MLNWILSPAWNTELGATGVIESPESFRMVYFRPSAVPLAGGGAVVRAGTVQTR